MLPGNGPANCRSPVFPLPEKSSSPLPSCPADTVPATRTPDARQEMAWPENPVRTDGPSAPPAACPWPCWNPQPLPEPHRPDSTGCTPTAERLAMRHPRVRTACVHVDASSRGVPQWEYTPYYPGGAVQGEAADSNMAKDMRLVARMGHPCGQDFLAKPFLAEHPEYAWQEPYLRDMKAGDWTIFRAGEKPVIDN